MIESLGELGGIRAETLIMKYGKDRRYYVRLAVRGEGPGTLRSEKGCP